MSKRRQPSPKAQHRGTGPWVRGYSATMDEPCKASTVRDPELGDWSPDRPETVVPAVCIENRSHKGWHLAQDGYAWSPDDDAQHVMLQRG